MSQHTYTYLEKSLLFTHPMTEYISWWTCGKIGCSAEYVSVSEAGYSIFPHSGDAYGNYPLNCKMGGKIEHKSFADN